MNYLFSIFDYLISTDFPWVLRVSLFPTENPWSSDDVYPDEYKKETNKIGDDLRIRDDDDPKYECKKSEYRHEEKD